MAVYSNFTAEEWEALLHEAIRRRMDELFRGAGGFASGGEDFFAAPPWAARGGSFYFGGAPCESFSYKGSYKEDGAHLEGARDRCRRGETWRRYRPGGAYPFTQAGYLAVSEEPEVATAAEEYRRAKRRSPPMIGSDGMVVIDPAFVEAEKKLRRRVATALERAAKR